MTLDPRLEAWLAIATRRLAPESCEQVGAEISEHYHSAVNDALASGAAHEDAGQAAIRSLGRPHAANRLYCRSLLTMGEARHLRSIRKCDARPSSMIFTLVASILIVMAVVAWADGEWAAALSDVLLGVMFGLVDLRDDLSRHGPIPESVRRFLNGTSLVLIAANAFAMRARGHSALLVWTITAGGYLYGWHMVRLQASIRRKLPVDQWPRNLYL